MRTILLYTHPSGVPEVHLARDCPPGTPAGPNPDRAEMLLAEGLAKAFDGHRTYSRCNAGDVADAATEFRSEVGADWSAAYNAAHEHFFGVHPECAVCRAGDEGNPDAYAAGAALAMALEDA